MGDLNQQLYVQVRLEHFEPPYLEVGSLDHGSTQDLRGLLRGRLRGPGDYLGVDMQDGPGVDRVLDLAADFASVERAAEGQRFASIFCLSVLEHCARPFQMAENLTRLLTSDGVICIGVPFAWKFHGYPSDYWRFTHEGVKQLFPELRFDPADSMLATDRDHHLRPLDEELGRIPLSFGTWRRRGQPLRGLWTAALRRLLGHRYLLPPTNLLMLGRRS